MKPKIVLDTSVFVSALMSARLGSTSRGALRSCLDGRSEPLMGAALYLEYESLLGRSELWSESLLDSGERERVLDAFMAKGRWTRVYYLWRPNLRDEADNHLVELALAGGAEYLVTLNLRDFRDPQLTFPQLRVLSPKDFLAETRG